MQKLNALLSKAGIVNFDNPLDKNSLLKDVLTVLLNCLFCTLMSMLLGYMLGSAEVHPVTHLEPPGSLRGTFSALLCQEVCGQLLVVLSFAPYLIMGGDLTTSLAVHLGKSLLEGAISFLVLSTPEGSSCNWVTVIKLLSTLTNGSILLDHILGVFLQNESAS